jgi:N-acetylmuramoyl-L-alanine amidase
MAYTFKRDMVASSKYSVKCPYSMKPKYITIHNTSNSAPAQNEISYMKNNNNATSYHVCVDEKYVIQAIPFNRNAWHAGDGANGTGNRYSIGIEIARSTGDINLFKQAEQNCAIYVAQLLKNYGWGIDRVKRHKDWSGKNCPHKTIELGWQRFLNMIQAELNKLNGKTTTTTNTTSFKVGDKVVVKSSATTYADSTKVIPAWVKGGLYTISKISGSKVLLKEIVSWVKVSDVQKSGTSSKSVSYVVKVTVDFLNIRSGAGTNFPVTGTVKKGEAYTIVKEKNGFGKLKSDAGWISLDCTKRV